MSKILPNSQFCGLSYFMRPANLGILIILVLSSAQALSQAPPARARDLGSLGDVNWGYVQLEATGQATPIPPFFLTSSDTELALYDANGNLLEQNDDIAGQANRNSRITWNTPAEGRYYVAVGLNDTVFGPGFEVTSSSLAAGRYSLSPSRETLPNGVPPFNTLGGTLTPTVINWFTFTIESDPTDPTDPTDPADPPTNAVALGIIGDSTTPLQLTTAGSSIDTEIALFSSEGNLILENDDLPDGTRQGAITAPNLTPGTYFVAVGQYNTVFGDDFAAQSSSTTPGNFILTAGSEQPISGQAPPNGVQWFTFTIESDPIDPAGPPTNAVALGIIGDSTTPLQLTTAGSSIDTEIALYGSEGNLIQENDDLPCGNRQAAITVANLTPGTYYVAVGQYDTVFADGFGVQSTSGNAGDFFLAAGLGQTFSGQTPPNGVQWFTFLISSSPRDLDGDGIPEVKLVEVIHDPRGDTTQLTWESTPGQFFEVAKTTDLSADPATWTRILTEIEAAPGAETSLIVDEAAVEAQAFYKVFETRSPALPSGDGSSREQAIGLGRIPTGELVLDTTGSVVGDTEIGLYGAGGDLLASNDDDPDLGLLSRISVCVTPGIYYVATGAYNTTFNPSGFSVVAPFGITDAFTVNVVSEENGAAPAGLSSSGVNTGGAVWFSLVVE